MVILVARNHTVDKDLLCGEALTARGTEGGESQNLRGVSLVTFQHSVWHRKSRHSSFYSQKVLTLLKIILVNHSNNGILY